MPSVNRGAAETLREALRPGVWGYVQDIRVLATPWDFDLDEIAAPVQLWHGDQDLVIPLHHGRYLASVIPNATLRICPGEGHMLMWSHLPEILMAVAGMPTPPGPLRRHTGGIARRKRLPLAAVTSPRATRVNARSYSGDVIHTAIWARELRPSLFMMLLT